ncbi:excisionase family DNA-binding protein [Mycolicibacterium palauense]|uniref:excisionase family DNA-binding protein n=1 Tax=Mycolicibacterium palauense TaxID=2034511 RepID=UPI000BFF09AF|nr:helix-turn-helix domain-containing protein [Mycolicibacterium palauense]
MNQLEDGVEARLWPTGEVAQRLGVGRTTVFALISSGELRSVKIGRRRLVSEASICDYIARLDGGAA